MARPTIEEARARLRIAVDEQMDSGYATVSADDVAVLLTTVGKMKEAIDAALDYELLDERLDAVERGEEHPDMVWAIRFGDLLNLRAVIAPAEGESRG